MAEFSWSPARAEIFRRCPRQYWFQFYGSGPAWNPRADERTRAIFVLSRLQSREAWADATVRNCLRWVLDTMRKTGAPPPAETTLQHLGRRMQKDYIASGEGIHWEDPANHRGLAEHEYEERDVPDEDWQELFEAALLRVSVFFNSELFQKLQTVPKDAWLAANAHREGDRVIVHEWITGFEAEPVSAEPSNFPPEKVTRRVFDLMRNLVSEGSIAKRDESSEAALRALHDAPENKFAFTDDENECARCNFMRLCPKFAAELREGS